MKKLKNNSGATILMALLLILLAHGGGRGDPDGCRQRRPPHEK